MIDTPLCAETAQLQLEECVYSRDARRLQQLVSECEESRVRLDANRCGAKKFSNARPLLCYAASQGDLDIVRLLVRCGADALAREEKLRNTAAHCAALRGHLPVLEWLLDRTATSVFETNALGHTLLLSAVCGGHVRVAEVLLSRGASLRGRDANQQTAFSLAASHGHIAMLRWLLARAIDNKPLFSLADVNSSGCTVLHLAAGAGKQEMVKYLVNEMKMSAQIADASGWTPMLLAAAAGHAELVRFLLSTGHSHLNEQVRGQSAMLVAARGGHISVVQSLVRSGAHISQPDARQGYTALLLAAKHNHVPLLRWLLEVGGANLQREKTKKGYTALLLAASHGCLETVQYLVRERGVSVRESVAQQTALLSAARANQLPLLQWLLTSGGSSLKEADSNHYTALLMASWAGHFEIVRYLVEVAGADCQETDRAQNNALHLACSRGHLHLIEYLIKKARVNIHALNRDGATPLLLAAQNAHTEVFQNLLFFGGGLCAPYVQSAVRCLRAKALEARTHEEENLMHKSNGVPSAQQQSIVFPKFCDYVLIGSDVSRECEGFEECIFDVYTLRRALLTGVKIDRWVLRDLVSELLGQRNSGALLRLSVHSRVALENIEDDLLYALQPASSLQNLCLNFLNCSRAGKKTLQQRAAQVLPSELFAKLLSPQMSPAQEQRMAERENERLREEQRRWQLVAPPAQALDKSGSALSSAVPSSAALVNAPQANGCALQ